MFDIIFFAAIAGFILYRLYSVLGQEDDSPRNTHNVSDWWQKQADKNKKDSKLVSMPKNKVKEETNRVKEEEADLTLATEETWQDIRKLQKKDGSFNAKAFISGAEVAFEMVLEAFAKGDKATLKDLLSKELYKDFAEDIDDHNKAGEERVITLISIEKTEITMASTLGKKAVVSVRFISEQVEYVKDKDGNVIEGDESAVEEAEDIWTFERAIGSSNPNWTIVSVEG